MVDLFVDVVMVLNVMIMLLDNYDDLEFFFDSGMANGATGRASVSRENIILVDLDVDDFDV